MRNKKDPPQKPGFNLEGPGFSDQQMGILVDSLRRIREDDCSNFINQTLAKYKVSKGLNSLDKLLNRARFGFYDNSWSGPDYSPQDLGLDSHGALLVRAAFPRAGVAAVTAPDRVHVFLSDAVFERSSSFIPIESWNHKADTPGYIVHGKSRASKEIVKVQNQNCRIAGLTPGWVRFFNTGSELSFQNGPTSSAPIAGTITSAPGAASLFSESTSVADAFSANPGLNALTSITSATLSIFVRPGAINPSNHGNNPDNKALLLHEAIHGYGGTLGGTSYFDDEIQKAFGLKVDPRNTRNITQYIKKHCF